MAGARRRRGGRHEARSPAELTSSAIIHTELSPSLSPPAGRKHGTGNGGWLPSSATWTRWPQPDEPSPSVSTPTRCTECGALLVSCDAVPSRRLLKPPNRARRKEVAIMRPRPFGSGVAAAAEVLVGAGCGGWAWRPRSGARPRGVRVGGASNPHAAAAASALHSEHHHGGVHGVQFRSVGLPGVGYGSDVEAQIEKAIYACRFMTFIAIAGSLAGSVPCFLKGCVYVMDAFMEYNLHGRGKVILMLVEAIDMYLIGTVMFVFGTGLYELFISNMDIAKQSSYGSNLFGLFRLPERPKWLEIQSVNDLKTKLGHVIVMVLLVGIFEKSKRVTITSCADLLCFAASIFLSSGCLYLLSRLSSTKGGSHA